MIFNSELQVLKRIVFFSCQAISGLGGVNAFLKFCQSESFPIPGALSNRNTR